MTTERDYLRVDDAERELVGCCLLAPQITPIVCIHVMPADFGNEDAKAVFTAISDANEAGEPPVKAVLGQRLDRRLMVLALTWASESASPFYAGWYAQTVLKMATRRRIVAHSTAIAQAAINGGALGEELEAGLHRLRKRLGQLDSRPFAIPAGTPTVFIPSREKQLEPVAVGAPRTKGVIDL